MKFTVKEKAIFCGFLIAILFSFTNFSARCSEIGNKIFRLHIIANSDSVADQELKIKIRDEILKKYSKVLGNTKNLIAAEKITKTNLKNIEKTAQNVINKNGFSYTAHAEVKKMYFNTRKYDNFTVPSGNYDALRITLGKGKGKNWWCVMFPPMCVPAAEERLNFEEIFDSKEERIIENKDEIYEVRFKFFEMFYEIHNFIFNTLENFDIVFEDNQITAEDQENFSVK